jgi:hypothetical protein
VAIPTRSACRAGQPSVRDVPVGVLLLSGGSGEVEGDDEQDAEGESASADGRHGFARGDELVLGSSSCSLKT